MKTSLVFAYATSEEIFRVLDVFFEKSELAWTQCVGVCTDGAAAMTGRKSGLVARVKQAAPHSSVSTHCVIHREALAAKDMNNDLAEAFPHVLKLLTSSKPGRSITVCLETCAAKWKPNTSIILLLHTEFRWLSRGRVVQRVYELRDELLIFLNQHNESMAHFFTGETWVARLAYLADIFKILNSLNLSLQGLDTRSENA